MENEQIKELVRVALMQLNWNYGRGDIYKIEWNPDMSGGITYHSLQFGECKYNFKFNGKSVFFINHQKRII